MRPTLPHIHFYRGLKAAVSLALFASSATMHAQMPETGGETVSLDSCRAVDGFRELDVHNGKEGIVAEES